MSLIEKSVGRGALNRSTDVKTIQQLLNKAIDSVHLDPDGKIGPSTIAAIDYFQSKLGLAKPDGRVDPNGATLIGLNNSAEQPHGASDVSLPASGKPTPLDSGSFQAAAQLLGCDVATIQAVTEVESKGAGFLDSGRPKILFEAHIFSRFTYHCFDKEYPEISSRNWNKKLYVGDEGEFDRLVKAMALDRTAALKSASWGMFQLMGFNYVSCGYASVETFVSDMFVSEQKHLLAFVRFIQSNPTLAKAIRAKAWDDFAEAYNGPDYFEQDYDGKIAAAYKKYAGAK